MSSFKGSRKIILQENDSNISFQFTFSVCSSAVANDGFLPFGTTIESFTVQGICPDGSDCSTALIESSSESNEVITVKLNYPTGWEDGRYSLIFVLTLSDTSTIEADFKRIYVGDK